MVPKFLKYLLPFFLITFFASLIFNEGDAEFSTFNVLTILQDFDYSLDGLLDLIARFGDGTYFDAFYTWNDDLDFFYNVAMSISSFFSVIGTIISDIVVTLFTLIVDTVNLVFDLIRLVASLFGLMINNPIRGSR